MDRSKELVSFDYAIKYLLRDKGDYSIVEGFISALLKTIGYNDIKIITVLESESNKEDGKSKRSLADVIVEDKDKNKYIIEIERNVKDSFIHKACFNTSRLIVDNLAQRVDYTQIVKVFHISLLYFPIGKGSIYHGKTIIHEIETSEKLSVHIKNQETNEVFDATDILPEYFFISVPQFNDRLDKEIDEWLHVMKYDEVPPNYQSPYMKQVTEKLTVLKMTPEERANYIYYQKKVHNDRDELQAAINRGREEGEAIGIEKGKAEGKAEGIAEGETKGKVEIALMMLADGEPMEKIIKFTKLTKEKINKIQKD